MGKPAIYGTPASSLPPVKGNQRDEERYKRVHKAIPAQKPKKSK